MFDPTFDGVIKSEFLTHIDEVAHKQTQPSEGIILARNAELRKNPGSIMDLGARGDGESWGQMVASIPFNMYEAALRKGFDMNHKDAKFAAQEMNRYLQSTEGRMTLVQGKN